MDSRNVDIVLVRMDKIGDLVLSMPVDEHPVFKGRRIHWFISAGLGFIAEKAVPQREASEYRRRFSLSQFSRMVTWLRQNRPGVAVLLHNPWWVSMAAWWAGVPVRIGRRSQWHSFLFLNQPVVQSRSTSDRHECDFNFDLVEWAFNRMGVRASENLAEVKKTFLRLRAPSTGVLQNRGLSERGFYVVHPGMAGSALNWPASSFRELIEQLAKDAPVAVTGTKADSKYLKEVLSVRASPAVRWLVDELNTSELMELLSGARGVVAPSTGVLHLAASLGTPALGIYSPRKVEHPRRWGPKGSHVRYLLPPVMGDSQEFDKEVMNLITVEQVLYHLRELEKENVQPQSYAGV